MTTKNVVAAKQAESDKFKFQRNVATGVGIFATTMVFWDKARVKIKDMVNLDDTPEHVFKPDEDKTTKAAG